MHPVLNFILVFILLNYVFGLIQFLINPMSMNFLAFDKKKSLVSNIKVFSRVIKFNADFAILTIILLLTAPLLPHWVCTLLLFLEFIFIFSYQIYYHAIKKLYNTQPNFVMDNKLLQLGFQVVFFGYRLYFFLGIIGLILLFYSFYWACSYFATLILSQSNPLIVSIILSIIPLAAALALIVKKRSMWGYPKMRFYFTSFMVYHNLKDSFDALRLIKKFTKNEASSSPQFNTSLQLEQQPNIIFLVLESYGKILFEKYKEEFNPLLDQLENQLSENGFHSISNLSTSPRSGGGSWMCYSSFLYGMEVQNEGLFRIILEKENAANFNPSLLEILRRNGYENYLLNPLTGFKNLKINWEEISELFSTKDIIKYEDLDYKGKLIGALGLQPPDQFSLNKGFELLREKNKGRQPFALFFETLNSHAKWQSPIHVEKDWKKYDQSDYDFEVTKMVNDSYFPSIRYQISMAVDFITRQMDDNTLILIMGDHQPPLVTTPTSGNETPIHLISKNENLLKPYMEYGFEKGLKVSQLEKDNVSHPGMYYAVLRSLIQSCSEDGTALPDYLPKGMELK